MGCLLESITSPDMATVLSKPCLCVFMLLFGVGSSVKGHYYIQCGCVYVKCGLSTCVTWHTQLCLYAGHTWSVCASHPMCPVCGSVPTVSRAVVLCACRPLHRSRGKRLSTRQSRSSCMSVLNRTPCLPAVPHSQTGSRGVRSPRHTWGDRAGSRQSLSPEPAVRCGDVGYSCGAVPAHLWLRWCPVPAQVSHWAAPARLGPTIATTDTAAPRLVANVQLARDCSAPEEEAEQGLWGHGHGDTVTGTQPWGHSRGDTAVGTP